MRGLYGYMYWRLFPPLFNMFLFSLYFCFPGSTSHNHLSLNKPKVKPPSYVKPSKPRGTTLMKPTASHLARQNFPTHYTDTKWVLVMVSSFHFLVCIGQTFFYYCSLLFYVFLYISSPIFLYCTYYQENYFNLFADSSNAYNCHNGLWVWLEWSFVLIYVFI